MALTKVSTPAIKDEAITLAKLLHGDSNSNGKFLRANNGADPTFETVDTSRMKDPAGTTIVDTLINGEFRVHGKFSFDSDSNNTYSIDIQAPSSLTKDSTFTLPEDGSNGQFLKTNGSGVLSFATVDLSSAFDKGGGDTITGDFTIASGTTNKNINIDVSDKVRFDDNLKATFGNSDDLSIFHNGSNTQIVNNTGHLLVGSERIKLTNPAHGDVYLDCILSGSVELYHSNSKRFQTEAWGTRVFATGQDTKLVIQGEENRSCELSLYADDGDDYADYTRLHKNKDTGKLHIQNYASGNWEDNIVCFNDGPVELYHDNTKQCETSANGLAFPSGKGIDFSATSDASGSSNELLADYEEGSWTPIVTFGGNSSGQSYSYQIGQYVKVGRLVHIQCYVAFSSIGSSTGTAKIEGLPYATKNVSAMYPSAVIPYFDKGNSSAGPGSTSTFMAYGEFNQAVLNIYREEITDSTPEMNDAHEYNFANDTSFMLTMTYVSN